jgi:hypothetical protein
LDVKMIARPIDSQAPGTKQKAIMDREQEAE